MTPLLLGAPIIQSEAASQGDATVIIWVSVIGAATSIATAVIAALATRHAKEAKIQATQANDAVNHRHEGQPRLFDNVLSMSTQMGQLAADMGEIKEWHGKWASLDGTPLSTGTGLVERFDSVDSKLEGVTSKLEEHTEAIAATRRDLRDHVLWEETRKYPEIEGKVDLVDQKVSTVEQALVQHVINPGLTECARVVLLGLEALRKEMDVVKRDIITREVRERLPEVTDTAFARDLGESSPPDPV